MPSDWNPSDENLKELKIGSSIRKRVRKELQESLHLYLEKRHDERGRFQGRLWHVSNVPLKDDEYEALIRAAVPDHLSDTQPGEAAEGTNDATEVDPATNIGNPVETSPEPLSEDTRKDVEEKGRGENTSETAKVGTTIDGEDPVETSLESFLKKQCKEVQGIWGLWNEIGDIRPDQWSCQDTPSTEIANAIAQNLENHDSEEILEAIENYARVRLEDGYNCPDLMNMLEFFTSEDSDGNKKWHQYLEVHFNLEDFSIADGLCQASNVPPSEDKTGASAKEADPDPLHVTQHEEATENESETSEADTTNEVDDSVEALLDSLPEDKRKEVQGIWVLWNEMAEIDPEQWISHQTQTTEMVAAIVDNLEKHKYKEIAAAINNYADVRLNDEFDYSESMNLIEFLTNEDADGNKRWLHFHDDTFDCEDFRKAAQNCSSSAP